MVYEYISICRGMSFNGPVFVLLPRITVAAGSEALLEP